MMNYCSKCLRAKGVVLSSFKGTSNAHYILFLSLFVSWVPLHDEGKRDVIVQEKLWISSN